MAWAQQAGTWAGHEPWYTAPPAAAAHATAVAGGASHPATASQPLLRAARPARPQNRAPRSQHGQGTRDHTAPNTLNT